MNFCSDNVTGVAPEIIAALMAANDGAAMPYGDDKLTRDLTHKFSTLFETDLAVFPVATGGAANGLSLSVMAPVFGSIYCHEGAHINVNECGGPEFFTGGAKLIALPGDHGKITPDILRDHLRKAGQGDVHHTQPAVLSLTQATDAGTLYSPDEIRTLSDIARSVGMTVHMDGARFANAVAGSGAAPAALTWKAGVDILSFGATKNGAMAAEAVVIFNPSLIKDFAYRRKRGGHLFSKMRFISAQLDAYVTDGLWLKLAGHANRQAQVLAQGLGAAPDVTLLHPVQANEVFARMPVTMVVRLENDGFQFYRWQENGDGTIDIRLVTAFNTKPEDVSAFLASACPVIRAAS